MVDVDRLPGLGSGRVSRVALSHPALRHLVGERAQPLLLCNLLEAPVHAQRVRDVQAPSRSQVRVVHHNVGVRDSLLVVVVVDDGDLVVGEVLLDPGVRKLAQSFKADAVARIRGDHVVTERDGALPLPWRVVAIVVAQCVHL